MGPSSNGDSSVVGSQGGIHVLDYLANFIENSLDAIVATDTHGRIVFWNLAAERTLGWDTSEALGKRITELFWPTNIAQDQEDQKQRQLRLQRGEVVKGEQLIRCKDGSPLWIAYTIRTVIDNEIANEPAGFVAVYRDITARKQAEEQRDRSNQRLNQILDSIQDDFYSLDRDWKFVYANRQFTSKVGKEPKDFVGNNFWEMFPKHVGGVLYENFHAVMEKRQVRRFEMPGKYTNAWYIVTAFPSEEGITVLGTDITDRKRMEREIESLARFPMENPNPVLRIQRDGVIAFANAASDNVLRLWHRVVGESLPESEHKLILQTLESRAAIEQEVDCTGRIYSLIFTPVAESGYVNIYGRDITQRVQAEWLLRRAQTDLERAQEVGQIGSWRLDIRQNVLTWSDENHRIFGVPVGVPLSYETFLGIVHPNDRQYVDAQWNEGMAGASYDIEHRIVVDGRVKWVREKAYREFDDTGNLLGGFGITQDITERKQAENALRESEEQLRMLNETLEQRVNEKTAEVRRLASDLTKAEQRERHRIAQILHEDLQQRIYAVKMQLEFLQEGLGTENRLISQEIGSVNKQLAEILAHTRHLSVELSPPILRDEGLTQAFQWLAFQMEKQHGIQIAVKAEGSYFIADESLRVMLFTCVRELLFNIVKHAGVNQALVSLRQSNADLQIEVQDQGKGFDIAVLEEGDKIIKEEGEPRRHSFGLPTLRHQLGLIGGQMEIQSEPDRGTFITITIPYA